MQKLDGKRKGRGKWWVGGVLFLLLVVGIGGWIQREEAPEKEIEEARRAVREAEKAGAPLYQAELFRLAKSQYDSAMLLWREENGRFILFRRFAKVTQLAERAERVARKAAVCSENSQEAAAEKVRKGIAELRAEMERFDRLFVRLPLEKKVKEGYARGKLLLNEAEMAAQRGKYVSAQRKEREARELLLRAYRMGKEKVRVYLKKLPEWKEWKAAAVEYSRQTGKSVVVVEKLPACCRVYRKGKECFTAPVEFGAQWLGPKLQEGDRATPEGRYEVRKKLQGKATRYYKALLLNYPNKEDLENFRYLKKSGHLPAGAEIGGLIEIHGEGGRGSDWTNGCVALENREMDRLFKWVEPGTPVVIIGASDRCAEWEVL